MELAIFKEHKLRPVVFPNGTKYSGTECVEMVKILLEMLPVKQLPPDLLDTFKEGVRRWHPDLMIAPIVIASQGYRGESTGPLFTPQVHKTLMTAATELVTYFMARPVPEQPYTVSGTMEVNGEQETHTAGSCAQFVSLARELNATKYNPNTIAISGTGFIFDDVCFDNTERGGPTSRDLETYIVYTAWALGAAALGAAYALKWYNTPNPNPLIEVVLKRGIPIDPKLRGRLGRAYKGNPTVAEKHLDVVISGKCVAPVVEGDNAAERALNLLCTPNGTVKVAADSTIKDLQKQAASVNVKVIITIRPGTQMPSIEESIKTPDSNFRGWLFQKDGRWHAVRIDDNSCVFLIDGNVKKLSDPVNFLKKEQEKIFYVFTIHSTFTYTAGPDEYDSDVLEDRRSYYERAKDSVVNFFSEGNKEPEQSGSDSSSDRDSGSGENQESEELYYDAAEGSVTSPTVPLVSTTESTDVADIPRKIRTAVENTEKILAPAFKRQIDDKTAELKTELDKLKLQITAGISKDDVERMIDTLKDSTLKELVGAFFRHETAMATIAEQLSGSLERSQKAGLEALREALDKYNGALKNASIREEKRATQLRNDYTAFLRNEMSQMNEQFRAERSRQDNQMDKFRKSAFDALDKKHGDELKAFNERAAQSTKALVDLAGASISSTATAGNAAIRSVTTAVQNLSNAGEEAFRLTNNASQQSIGNVKRNAITELRKLKNEASTRIKETAARAQDAATSEIHFAANDAAELLHTQADDLHKATKEAIEGERNTAVGAITTVKDDALGKLNNQSTSFNRLMDKRITDMIKTAETLQRRTLFTRATDRGAAAVDELKQRLEAAKRERDRD